MVKQDQNHLFQSKESKKHKQNPTEQKDIQKSNHQSDKKKNLEEPHDFDRNEGEGRSQKI